MTPETEEKHGEIEEEEEEEEGEGVAAVADGGREEAPTHLPFASSPEFSGISTTVDPSYIISLIRKLLPHDGRTNGCPKSISNDITFAGASEAGMGTCTGEIPVLSLSEDMKSRIELLGKTGESDEVSEQSELPAVEDVWEDSGCILWDLAANSDHAKFMVDNFVLDVLLINLSFSKSARVMEICLGIMGNLACHDVLGNAIISTAGLVETIVNQLALNDTACLCEVCRLLTVGLQGDGFVPWLEALCPEYILQRILWIVENTLNSQLQEKVMELLLAIISREEIANILLPSLTKLGLSDLLVCLLSCEISKQIDNLGRISILVLILELIEILSTNDCYSRQISSNKRLLQLLLGIIKLPDKDEVGSSCETSVVIIANILTDESHLASELAQDIPFLQGLLDTLPLVTCDPQARNALWSILARSLIHLQENYLSKSRLQQYVSVLLEKAYLIEDDLEGNALHDSGEHLKGCVFGEKENAITISLKQIAHILNQWRIRQPASEEGKLPSDNADDKKVKLLLDYCCKYTCFCLKIPGRDCVH